MDDKTKTMMLTIAAGVIKKGLLTLSAGAVTHGLINSNQTEYFVAGGMLLVSAAWSFWNDYGKAIVLSQLEVLKAKSLAQAQKMTQAGVTPVTTAQIAAQSPTMGPAEVAKVVATLPEVIQANVKGAVLVAVLVAGALLAFPAGVSAQGIKLKPLTGNISNDFGAAAADKSAAALGNIATVLAKPFQDIANFIGADADAAIALSTAIPNLQDGHGQQCWIAMKSFGDIIKAHPIPLTLHIINDYESLRLLGIATNNLCSNVHCTQVFADFTGMAQAASPMPLAIPSLHDLCTKVPQIAVVPPISLPAPTPADATPVPLK